MRIIYYLLAGLLFSGAGVLFWQKPIVFRQLTAEEKQRIKFEGLVRDNLRRRIDRAKAEGRDTITIFVDVLQSSITTLDQITSKYSLVRVQVKDKEISVSPNGSIQTWYKLDLLGIEHKQEKIGEETLPDHIPSRFLPLLPTESLLVEDGGSLTVDGVRIERVLGSNQIELHPQKEYLIAAHLDCEGKLIVQIAQSAGVFRIEGTTLHPLGQSHLGLVREVEQRYGNDLTRFRSDIQLGAALLRRRLSAIKTAV